MNSKFSQTPSRGEKFKELALSALRAFGYGCLTAAGMSAIIFAFAYFTSGMDMFTGIDWVRRVMYVISSLGIDRGYPRDTVEIIEHLGIRPNVERARKRAAQSILSNPDLCDHMRVNAESWYLRFGMDPKEIMDVSL